VASSVRAAGTAPDVPGPIRGAGRGEFVRGGSGHFVPILTRVAPAGDAAQTKSMTSTRRAPAPRRRREDDEGRGAPARVRSRRSDAQLDFLTDLWAGRTEEDVVRLLEEARANAKRQREDGAGPPRALADDARRNSSGGPAPRSPPRQRRRSGDVDKENASPGDALAPLAPMAPDDDVLGPGAPKDRREAPAPAAPAAPPTRPSGDQAEELDDAPPLAPGGPPAAAPAPAQTPGGPGPSPVAAPALASPSPGTTLSKKVYGKGKPYGAGEIVLHAVMRIFGFDTAVLEARLLSPVRGRRTGTTSSADLLERLRAAPFPVDALGLKARSDVREAKTQALEPVVRALRRPASLVAHTSVATPLLVDMPQTARALYLFYADMVATDTKRATRWCRKGRPRYNDCKALVDALLGDAVFVRNVVNALSPTTAAPAAPAATPAPRGRPRAAAPPAVAPLQALGHAAQQEVSTQLQASTNEVKRLKATCADQAAMIARLQASLKASTFNAALLDSVAEAFRHAVDAQRAEDLRQGGDHAFAPDDVDVLQGPARVAAERMQDLLAIRWNAVDASIAAVPGLRGILDAVMTCLRAGATDVKRRRCFLLLLEMARVRRPKGKDECLLAWHESIASSANAESARSLEARRRTSNTTVSWKRGWDFLKAAAALIQKGYLN